MSYSITVLDTGFVQIDTLKPVGYAGEINSRCLEITHPHFKDCYYQLLVKKNDDLYTLGVNEGMANIPASLLRTATKLNCQFVALATPDSITNSEVDNFVFKSNAFGLVVAEGLNTCGLSPIPPYEQLQEMYKNIEDAKNEVEKAKKDNLAILAQIEIALDSVKQSSTAGLEHAFRDEYIKQLKQLNDEQFEEFVSDVFDEIIKRLEDSGEIGECPCSDVGKMSKEELKSYITKIHNDLINEAKQGKLSLSNKFGAYTMNTRGEIIG